MWTDYRQPDTLAAALHLLAQHGTAARVVAGGTNLLVDIGHGTVPACTIIDISRISELRHISHHNGTVTIGSGTTYNDILARPPLAPPALPLVQACAQVGVPQIRNRATIAGNLAHASPAGDTITPLAALHADVMLASVAGERRIPLREFFHGARATARRPDELITGVTFPALHPDQRSIFVKFGLRNANTISVINLAIVLTLADPANTHAPTVTHATITLGSVAPTVTYAADAAAWLAGKPLTTDTITKAGKLVAASIQPIDDLHCSATYRRTLANTLIVQSLHQLASNTQPPPPTTPPVLLGDSIVPPPHAPHPHGEPVRATINGTRYNLSADKPLLEAIREDAGLTGTKRGCGEGRCGACTVWLDGQAVMACITPAAQAHGSTLTTIEGLAATGDGTAATGDGLAATGDGTAATAPNANGLHPLQAAFVRHGAVQCGYCTPGVLMSGARLLAERPRPTLPDIQQALAGNICRCTGYGRIIAALQDTPAPNAPEPQE